MTLHLKRQGFPIHNGTLETFIWLMWKKTSFFCLEKEFNSDNFFIVSEGRNAQVPLAVNFQMKFKNKNTDIYFEWWSCELDTTPPMENRLSLTVFCKSLKIDKILNSETGKRDLTLDNLNFKSLIKIVITSCKDKLKANVESI